MVELAVDLVVVVVSSVWDLLCRVLDKAGVGVGLRSGPERQPDGVLGLRPSRHEEHPDGPQ